MEDDEEMAPGEEDEGPEEQYPPWLRSVVSTTDDGTFDRVVLIADLAGDSSQPGFIRCKELSVPDARDADQRLPVDQIRMHRVRDGSTVMIASGPQEPPYIGLVEKIWRSEGAEPVAPPHTFTTADFKLECYWFYRPREVPATAWRPPMRRRRPQGAEFRFPRAKKTQSESCSERQLLFSSHHTLHDYPDDNGLLSLDGFLQTCRVHWVPMGESLPERYCVRGERLVRVLEPGFVAQGFLFCGRKGEPQLPAKDKRACRFGDDWDDPDTMGMASAMLGRSRKVLEARRRRNEAVVADYQRHRDAARAGSYTRLASDDGSLDGDGPGGAPGGSQEPFGGGGGGQGLELFGGSDAAAAAADDDDDNDLFGDGGPPPRSGGDDVWGAEDDD